MSSRELERIEREHRTFIASDLIARRHEEKTKALVRNTVTEWSQLARHVFDLDERAAIQDFCIYWNINVLDAELVVDIGDLPLGTVSAIDAGTGEALGTAFSEDELKPLIARFDKGLVLVEPGLPANGPVDVAELN